MRVLALLCALGAARALDETCSTLWSKLAHLGCRPQDQVLRDHLDTLTLADGGVVTLRCTENHAFCFRADTATAFSHAPKSFVDLGSSSRSVAEGSIVVASSSRRPDLAPPTSPSAEDLSVVASSRRHLLTLPTPLPTSAPTYLPTPSPTYLPTPAPSVSPVPTTAEITTWSQLVNAVADPAVSTITVGVDIAFPAQIEVARNVTIVGVGGPDTALRDAGAPLERLFYVSPGAALRIESLHLLNNASSMSFDACSAATTPPFNECRGTLIYAYQARVELVGCTLRDTRGGYSAALMLTTSTSLVTNCTFARLEGKWGSAVNAYLGSTAVVESSLFHDNVDRRSGGIVVTCAFSLSSFLPPTPPLQNLSHARRH